MFQRLCALAAVCGGVVVASSGSALAVSPGETCSTATELFSDGPLSFDNSGAAADGPPGSCNTGSATTMQNAVWYRRTWDEPSLVTMTINPVSYDGIVQVYRGSCGSLAEVVCGDEPEPIVLLFRVAAGEPYFFQFGDWGVSPGGGVTEVTMSSVPISSDDCASAGLIRGDALLVFDNSGATPDAPAGTCNSASATTMQNSVWYWLEFPTRTEVTITADFEFGVGYDGIFQVYQGVCGFSVPVVCGDEPEPAIATFTASAGVRYLLQIGDWGTFPGGGLTRVFIDAVQAPGEVCVVATPIAEGDAVTFNNSTATADAPAGTCNTGSATVMQNAVWFEFRPAFYSRVRMGVDEFGGYDAITQVWRGSCAAPIPVACGDQPEPIETAFLAIPGQSYWIQSGDWGLAAGGGQTELALDPFCPADVTTDGVLSFADVQAFINAFTAPSPAADMNGDGQVNFADLQLFIERFNLGC